MNGGKIFLSRIAAISLLVLVPMGLGGCARKEPPAQKSARPDVVQQQTPQQPPEPNPVETPATPQPPEPHLLEGSGVTVWAKESEGELIEGLDGNLYEAYARPTIERVQKALGDRGLYEGPVNGILDRPTMKSIFEFQRANYYLLQRCGVPTPHTRKMLEQGSHTDLSS